MELLEQVNDYLKNKTLKFNGYRDINGEQIYDDYDDEDTPDDTKQNIIESIVQGDLFRYNLLA